jgi:hypothetical protein
MRYIFIKLKVILLKFTLFILINIMIIINVCDMQIILIIMILMNKDIAEFYEISLLNGATKHSNDFVMIDIYSLLSYYSCNFYTHLIYSYYN